MCDLYKRIYSLCQNKGISIGKMCGELGISRGNLTELKMGRIKTLNAENLSKISGFFDVSIDYLLGVDSKEKAPTDPSGRTISDDDIKFALFGGDGEVTDAMYDEVRQFAAFVKRREADKKKE